MKKNLIYVAFLVALLTSCSSAYRTSQTPDDVYYSPGQQQMYADNYGQDQYETYSNSSDDYYLRMKARDYDRWSALDDYDYWYDSRYYANNYYSSWTPTYSLGLGYYGLGYGYYNPYSFNSFYYSPWQSLYYPYYTVVYYKNPTVYYRPVSRYNLSTYSNKTYNNYNMPLQRGNRSNAYNNSNASNQVRRGNNNYYQQNNNGNNQYNNNYNNNNNTYTPSRSFNNSGNSGGGGSRVNGGGNRTRP
ncbi:MAG: hypothetical protein JST21_09610 [Bacteroidetes bacterium]|nr:hypothetical protein [Bacteroidota bacterium]